MVMIVSGLMAVPSEDFIEWHAPSPIARERCDVADADSTPLRVKVYLRAFMFGKIHSAKMRALEEPAFQGIRGYSFAPS
jgi:hypothetical protein